MELVGNTFYFDWEVNLMIWIQSHLGSVGQAIASFVSMFGEELIPIAVLGFMYWCYDKEFGKFIGLNVIVGNVFNPMLKNIFVRRRPYFDHTEIKCLKPVSAEADIYNIDAQGYSFPSGHSTNSVVVFTSLPMYRRKRWLWIIGTVIPFLVGISRFCLGVHYPTDVLAGWLLGLVIIICVPLIRSKIKNKWIFNLVLFLVCLPGFFYCKSSDYYTSFGMLTGFLLAITFEEKYVNFKSTRRFLFTILRLIGGIGLYFGLNTLLKLPFSSELLDSVTFTAHLIRYIRYTVVMFLIIGVYPMIFKRIEKE